MKKKSKPSLTLKDQLRQNQLRLEELEKKLKRALADYDNLEKRIFQQRTQWSQLAKAEVFDKLLAVFDDLERAEENIKNKGLSLAMHQLRSVLQSEGVEEIKALSKKFDPQEMDCVGLVAGSKNRVVSVTQKGYSFKDQIIRPAKVEVGSGSRKIN